MPPKEAAAPTVPKTVFLGRPGTSLKIGVVGMPNVGKSTFFSVLSKKSVVIENRPFATIEPNNADINVPDERFEKLCKIHKPASAVPAQVHIRDIAGLVRGASQGEGLGNAFLSHIAEVDGIFHMIRAFETTEDGDEVIHVEGEMDPIRDLEIIFSELCIKDMQAVQKEIDKLEPILRRGMDKTKQGDFDMLKAIKACLESGKQIRCHQWASKEVEFIQTLHLLTAKPAVFLINMSEKDYIRQRNTWIPKIKEWVDKATGEPICPISASFEEKLLTMPAAEAEKYCETNKTRSCISRVVQTGFNALNLIYFFTAGSDEVKCWTVQRGWKAPQAAGRIHSDMEKGFICAETIHWADFVSLESEAECRDQGKLHQMGKTYVVEDGDIMFFKFNKPAAAARK